VTSARRRTPRASLVLLVAVSCFAAAPAAQAFRYATPKEKRAVASAWKKRHKKKAKTLHIREVRVTKNGRFAAAVYDRAGPGLKNGFGFDSVEYFKRRGAHAGGARAAGILDDFLSLGQDAPPSARDDLNPVYRITYATTTDERIHRDITWDCGDGSSPTTTSTGTYNWSVTFANVPLSLPDFKINDRTSSSFSGTETLTFPCGGVSPKCSNQTIHYSRGGLSTAIRTTGEGLGSYFHNGYLVLTPGHKDDTPCLGEPGALPIAAVQIALPLTWSNGPIDDKIENVDESDFPRLVTERRLGDCATFDTANRCSETLDSFAGRVSIQRTHRR
jgi:hypothetical protein